MFCKVIKGAFDANFCAEVDRFAGPLQTVDGQVVEDSTDETRKCGLSWIKHGSKGFGSLEPQLLDLLGREDAIDPRLCVTEDLQYTEYGPGAFHNWHIDTYKRLYNMYDMPLGKRLIGKRRKISMSVLLNDASEFEGGTFEVSLFPNGPNTVGTPLTELSDAGDAAIFDSTLCHRVAPVTQGLRKSLVIWICA
jgi:hypothetical protein